MKRWEQQCLYIRPTWWKVVFKQHTSKTLSIAPPARLRKSIMYQRKGFKRHSMHKEDGQIEYGRIHKDEIACQWPVNIWRLSWTLESALCICLYNADELYVGKLNSIHHPCNSTRTIRQNYTALHSNRYQKKRQVVRVLYQDLNKCAPISEMQGRTVSNEIFDDFMRIFQSLQTE